MKEVVLPDCPPPLFALAHSMGATVLIQAAVKGHRWFDRMVLTAPMIRLGARRMLGLAPGLARILRLTGRGTSYVPGGGATVLATQPYIGNLFTSDPVRYARAAAVLETEPALGLG
jgi:lysophospholipase